MNTPDSAGKKGAAKTPSTTTTPRSLPPRNSKGQFMKTPKSQPAAAANPPTAPRKTARTKKVVAEVEASDDEDEDPEDIDTPSKKKVAKAPAKATKVAAAEVSDDDDEGPEEIDTPPKKKVTRLPVKATKASASTVRKRVPKKFGGRAPPLRDALGRFMKDPNKVEKAAGGKGTPEKVLATPVKKGKSSQKVVEEVEESDEEEEVIKAPVKRGRPKKKIAVEVAEEEESDGEEVVKTPARRGRPKMVPVEISEEESNGEQDVAKAPVKKAKKVVKRMSTPPADEVEENSVEEEISKNDTGKKVTDCNPKKVVAQTPAIEVKKSTPKKKKSVAFELESDDDDEDYSAHDQLAAKADNTLISLEVKDNGLMMSMSSKNPRIQITTDDSSMLDVASDGEATTLSLTATSPPRFATPQSIENENVAESASPAIEPKTGTGRKRSRSLTSECDDTAPTPKKARKEINAEPNTLMSLFG